MAVSGNPNGEACYPALVRGFVTVGVPAEEIHAVGLEQVAKIREEIQVTLDEHFGGGDVSEFLRRVNEDPAFTFVIPRRPCLQVLHRCPRRGESRHAKGLWRAAQSRRAR